MTTGERLPDPGLDERLRRARALRARATAGSHTGTSGPSRLEVARRSRAVLAGISPRRIPKEARRIDLRLLVPVLVVWPVVAFVALLAPVAWIWAAAVGAGLAGGAILFQGARRRARVLIVDGHGPVVRGHGPIRGDALPRSPPRAWRRPRPPRPSHRLVALTLVALCLALLAAAGHRTLRTVGPIEDLARERAIVTVHAQVATEPRTVLGGIREDGGAAEPMVIVRLDVSEVTARGTATRVGSPVLLIGTSEWADLEWHDEIEATVRLGASDPGDDVVAIAQPRGSPRLVGSPGVVYRAMSDVRADFRDATAHLPEDARGLVPALVIGDTSRTPPDLTQAMLDTGLSHLSAVSGSNVTLVLGAAMGLCQVCAVRRRRRPWVALAVLAGFVILARPEPSVIRAAVMGCVGLLGLSVSRRQMGVPALAGAIVALILWDPWLARSYGFALSSVATLGLLLFAQPWGRTFARRLPERWKWLGPVLAVPVAAQAVCAPIVVPLQGTVSLIAVLANLLAAPLVAPTTIVGVAVALLSVVWVGAASVVAWGAGVPALGIAWVGRACADAPLGQIAWGESAEAAMLLALITAVVLAAAPWAWHRSRMRPLVAVAVVLLASAFMFPPSVVGWPPPGWVLVACDVGQGDGLVVNAGAGQVVVVDTGPDPAAMDGCLGRLGISSVDLVVLTHFHADHAGGLAGVLDGRRVGQVRVTPTRDPDLVAADVDRLAAAAGAPVGVLRAGDSIRLGDLTADVWLPGAPISEGSLPNNASIVLTVHVRGLGILFTGDMEREAAAELVREQRRDPGRWGRIDVLKVAHHGSGNRDDRVLDAITGRVALISVGAGNDYGHPAPSTLSALGRRGFSVHRTDLEGDLVVVDRPEGLLVLGRGPTP